MITEIQVKEKWAIARMHWKEARELQEQFDFQEKFKKECPPCETPQEGVLND